MRAKIGMVFQSYNLWPHMTVLENVIEAPMRVRRLSRRDGVMEAEDLLERIGLIEKRNVYPGKLSGVSSKGLPLFGPWRCDRG